MQVIKKATFASMILLAVMHLAFASDPGPYPDPTGGVKLRINGLGKNVEFHSGDTGTISWTSENCSALLGFSSPTDPLFAFGKSLNRPSDSQSTSPITVNTKYTAECEDSDANLLDSDSVNVIAVPDLVISCSASPTSINVGDSATWSSSVSGGAGNYTYSWSGTDGLSGGGPSVTKIYTSAGTKSASLTVTSLVNSGVNSTKTVACSNTVNVSVPTPLCGNGILEGGEQCDNGGANGACPASCSSSCTTNSCVGPCNNGVDIGLRLYENGVRKVAVEPGAATSKLRVYKNGVRGVVLVDPSDPNASKMRVYSDGIKALCLLP